MSKICPCCKKEFTHKRKEKKYCSPECADKGRRQNLSIAITGTVNMKARTGENVTCKFCGKEFYVPKNRVKSAKFCSTTCKGYFAREHSGSMRICPICGVRFYKKGNRSIGTYCSRECGAIGRRTGTEINCKVCGESVYLPIARLKQTDNHFCSINCLHIWQGRNKIEYICKICGKSFKVSPSVVKRREHDIKYCSLACRTGDKEYINKIIAVNHKTQLQKPPSKLELLGRELLKPLQVSYVEQILLCDSICVDVLLHKYDIVIQWDGDYWHGNPARFPTLDNRQTKRLLLDHTQDDLLWESGYQVVRFWEYDMKNDSRSITQQIEEIINDYNQLSV